MVVVKVKWGKDTFEVDVDVTAPVEIFKAQLQSLTNVPTDRQKISGVKGGMLRDDADLSTVGLTPGKMLMLIGSADAASVSVPVAAAGSQDAAPPALPVEKKIALPSVGLRNVGNTCYLNSVVQALRVVPGVRLALQTTTHPVGRALRSLYEQMDATAQRDVVAPTLFFMNFITSFPIFGQLSDDGRPQQHDSQEALSSLLQALGAVPASVQAAAAVGGGVTPPPTTVFTGYREVSLLSDEADVAPSAPIREPFNMLTCPISADVTMIETGLEKALLETFTGKTASGGEALFTKRTRIAQLPEVLTIHMARFAWRVDTKSKAKVLKPVAFPMVFDINYLCTDELKAQLAPEREKVKERRDYVATLRRQLRLKPEDGMEALLKAASAEEAAKVVSPTDGPLSGYYELFAVVSHKGRQAESGHYVSWVKRGDDWFVCDDDNVGHVHAEDIQRLKGVGEAHIAYLLLYRARDPLTRLSPLNL